MKGGHQDLDDLARRMHFGATEPIRRKAIPSLPDPAGPGRFFHLPWSDLLSIARP